jgi:hypothetical protein
MSEVFPESPPAPVSPDLECTVCASGVTSPHGVPATPGQAAYEARMASRAALLGHAYGIGQFNKPWAGLDEHDQAHEEAGGLAAVAAFASVAPPALVDALDAVREPHAAPGPAGCECGHAQTGHAFSDDVCAVPDCPCPGYTHTPQPAPELAAATAVLRRVLEWFPVTGTRNEASATRAQLAHAYRDGGLTVPEELRRFL